MADNAMTDEMVERVAQAIWDSPTGSDRRPPWAALKAWVQGGPDDSAYAVVAASYSDTLAEARAAIEAMREPSPDMVRAGMHEMPNPHENAAAHAYRAMIDAALGEDGTDA